MVERLFPVEVARHRKQSGMRSSQVGSLIAPRVNCREHLLHQPFIRSVRLIDLDPINRVDKARSPREPGCEPNGRVRCQFFATVSALGNAVIFPTLLLIACMVAFSTFDNSSSTRAAQASNVSPSSRG